MGESIYPKPIPVLKVILIDPEDLFLRKLLSSVECVGYCTVIIHYGIRY